MKIANPIYDVFFKICKVRKMKEFLSIFDQNNREEGKGFILQSKEYETIKNPELQRIIVRPHEATLDEKMARQAMLEEEFDRQLDQAFRNLQKEIDSERILKEKERAAKEKERAAKDILELKLSQAIKALKENGLSDLEINEILE